MSANVKTANLALQGGGAHGAFAWGVLDRLLEDGRISVEAISATSAGAMNAVVFAYGISVGGYEGAREKLEEFWKEISSAGQTYSPIRSTPWERWLNGYNMEMSPSFHAFQALTHLFSPYQLNPLNFNPLRDVLEKVVDFKRLHTCNKATRLYISATNVRTGKIRVFENTEMSADAILASACLPYIFQAVEIDGEAYWDGGFMGNPAMFPLIYHSRSKDIIIVHINPLRRDKLPTTSAEIFNRINEISFNSSLLREMRAIAFVTRLIDDGKLNGGQYNRMLIHSIDSDEEMTRLGVASKLNPDWDFLCHLRDAGRARATNWLEANFAKVNQASSIDIGEVFL
ncbi:MAG: patatin-like phospholipase family protein [Pseudomonadota bacterium]|nr:patatin-like phospholipase family protein [Pseudomonadota bacterium]